MESEWYYKCAANSVALQTDFGYSTIDSQQTDKSINRLIAGSEIAVL